MATRKSPKATFELEDGTSYRDYKALVDNRKKYQAEQAARRTAQGGQRRRYLTEPPDQYRTPAETAAVGEVGEKEKGAAELAANGKKKSSIFKKIFGG